MGGNKVSQIHELRSILPTAGWGRFLETHMLKASDYGQSELMFGLRLGQESRRTKKWAYCTRLATSKVASPGEHRIPSQTND